MAEASGFRDRAKPRATPVCEQDASFEQALRTKAITRIRATTERVRSQGAAAHPPRMRRGRASCWRRIPASSPATRSAGDCGCDPAAGGTDGPQRGGHSPWASEPISLCSMRTRWTNSRCASTAPAVSLRLVAQVQTCKQHQRNSSTRVAKVYTVGQTGSQVGNAKRPHFADILAGRCPC